jgi:Rieske 2Fe-2S family protein
MSEAPLDRRALERVLLPPGRGRLLPQDAYTSAEVLEWEQKQLFATSWVCVGRADELARPGDQKGVRAGRDTLLLVRGADFVLRAFWNVCRHRAHELLQAGECTNDRLLRCPYHGWTYELSGALHPSVKSSHVPGFDPSEEGLPPLRAQEWHGFVFVNPSGDAPAFSEWVGDLEALAAPYRTETLRVGASHPYEIAANWKLAVENYDECYHCPRIHPELCRVSPPESGANNPPRQGAFVGGPMDLMPHAVTMSLDGKSGGATIPGLTGRLLREVHYYALVPNLLLSFHPDYVMTHRLVPLAPDRSFIECQWLFPQEALARPDFDPGYAVRFWDTTNQQDWRAIESVQRGIGSRGYLPGTLTPEEEAVHQFVSRMARAYLEGRFDPVGQGAAV